jgi:hypothetical protein
MRPWLGNLKAGKRSLRGRQKLLMADAHRHFAAIREFLDCRHSISGGSIPWGRILGTELTPRRDPNRINKS